MRSIVFGASGAIGAAIAAGLDGAGHEVLRTGRTASPGLLAVDPFGTAGVDALADVGPVGAAVWAQGSNHNDDVDDLEVSALANTLEANVSFAAATMHVLVSRGVLEDGARLCVVSSIWQELARPGKLSYAVSKAAVGGLVRAAAADLARRHMLVNAVLPGVLDTPMTRRVLTDAQVSAVERATGFGRLVTIADVVNTVTFLVSPLNTGVTGQSIRVDLGFSDVRPL